MYLSKSLTHSRANSEIDYYPSYAMHDISSEDIQIKTSEKNQCLSLKDRNITHRNIVFSTEWLATEINDPTDHPIITMRTW